MAQDKNKPMTEKLYISWTDFHQDVKNLAAKIKTGGVAYNKIVAVSRGGLLPAGILAYELDIRSCETVNMSSYDGENCRDDKDIEIAPAAIDADAQTLIVDDLSDSGRTFRLLRRLYPQAVFVAVYSKPAGRDAVDIYCRDMPDNWIVFPWD